MEFKLTFSPEQIQVVLRQLDVGQHNIVRPIIDAVLEQVKAQQDIFARAQEAVVEAAKGND